MMEIRKIIEDYDSMDAEHVRAALASVIHVEGSSYRRIGARMLVKSNGQWTGGISGGCLEGDALRKAQRAIFNGYPSIVTYNTMDNDAHELGVGLGCNGLIKVLFSPIDTNDKDNEIQVLRTILNDNNAALIVKVIGDTKDESNVGKVGIIKTLSSFYEKLSIPTNLLSSNIETVFSTHKSKSFTYSLPENRQINILLEYIRPEVDLIIVGDNYDIYALINAASTLGWNISIVGSAKKLKKNVFKFAQNVVEFGDIRKVNIRPHSAIILMAHDYKKDKSMLRYFIDHPPKYLGILGPRKRFLKMASELSIASETIDFIHSPTGLDIGAESPEEIATSIVAEIISVFREKPGGFLKLKDGPIHERTF